MTFQKVRLTQLAGVRADQPGATMVAEGTYYFVTDEAVVDRSNGTTWDEVLNVAAALAGFTPTLVPFADGAGALTEDSGFAYDATNNMLQVPAIKGGTGTGDDLTLKSTSGVGDQTSKVIIGVGDNGAAVVEVRVGDDTQFPHVGIGCTVGPFNLFTLASPLNVYGAGPDIGYLIRAKTHFSAAVKNAWIQMSSAGGSDAAHIAAQAGFTFEQPYHQVEWRMAVDGSIGSGDMSFRCNQYGIADDNYKLFFTKTGNIILDTSLKPPTGGTKCIVMAEGTVPSAPYSNSALFYADDVSGVVELFAMNESAVATQLTGISNTYTPTRSAEANLDANVTPSVAHYVRINNEVTVSGRFTADPTAAGAASFELTLPIASNIGAVEDCTGVAFCGAIAGQGAAISGSVANNTAVFSWVAVDTTSQAWSYSYAYRVI